MTMNEFWPAFLDNEYAVRCDTQAQHDQFEEKLCSDVSLSVRHLYSSRFPYLCWDSKMAGILGWSGLGSHSYGKHKITFHDWLAMQEEPEDDISVSSLEEVL